MILKKLTPEAIAHDGLLACTRILGGGVAEYQVLAPRQSLQINRPGQTKNFFVSQGNALISSSEESLEVHSGEGFKLPANAVGVIRNESETESLLLVTLLTGATEVSASLQSGENSPRRVLVTATPPTPNGDLHVGHLSGPYLGADIHNRYLKMRGIDSVYISGIDDHQSYVSFKAERTGTAAEETADYYGAEIQKTLSSASIVPTYLSFPRKSPQYLTFVEDFFKRLYAEGKLIIRDAPSLYCENCARYLFEAYVRGRCPHCGASSGGNACEDCGRPNDCVDLVNPECNQCNSTPITRSFVRIYFPLERYRTQLSDYCRFAHMSPHLRALCDRMLAETLPDISVSHLSNWGIPVPVSGFPEQTIYVWFEMAPGYLAATQALSEKLGFSGGWKAFWQSENSDVTQFFGFDNGYFHALLFPALFFAYDVAIRPPKNFVLNEFYRLDGLKFSTSRNHAIWGRELLSQHSTDAVRFYLSYSAPEATQTNFTVSECRDIVKRELSETWEPWLEELGRKVQIECSGISPSLGAWLNDHQLFHEHLIKLSAEAAIAYEARTFSPQRATRVLCELVRSAQRFGQREDHWRDTPGRCSERQTGIALELAASRTLALLAAPIMPEFASELWNELGCEEALANAGWPVIPQLVPAGQKIGKLNQAFFGSD